MSVYSEMIQIQEKANSDRIYSGFLCKSLLVFLDSSKLQNYDRVGEKIGRDLVQNAAFVNLPGYLISFIRELYVISSQCKVIAI